MPLLQYFGWIGSILLGALVAANWYCSAPLAPPPRSDVPLDRKINIRIHTDQKWPERVVFDTTRSRLAPEATVDPETNNRRNETITQVERQPFDAFAEIAAIPAKPCFRAPCSSGQASDRASPTENGARSQNRSSVAARKGLTFPNRLHKPRGKS
jgi:hypothetical protein